MSWIQKLYETYPNALTQADSKVPLTPPAHTLQTAHINIIIDGEGNFLDAKVMPPKTAILLPVTEASESRTSGEAPHPLADKLQYLADAYQAFGGEKKTYFNSYFALLSDWAASPYSHPKVKAVQRYVAKKSILQDLIKAQIFQLDDDGHIKNKWEEEGDAPAIFSVLPKASGKIEFGSALVCWSVEIPGELNSDTWQDGEVQEAWSSYVANQDGEAGFCLVTGENAVIASLHPAKLRHTGDKAKLISSNDTAGYTFRGRFVSAAQAASVSTEVTAKAHSALRWLIARQGVRNGEQVSVVWAVSAQEVPSPLEDPFVFIEEEASHELPDAESKEAAKIGKDWSVNVGQKAAEVVKKRLRGYQSELPPHESISLMMLDSATPGRMAITFYQEFLSPDYFANLEAWLTDFAWFQRHKYENGGGKKPFKTTLWPVLAPSPSAIFHTLYGAKGDEKLRKQLYSRLLPCIVGGSAVPIPRDLVEQAFQRACNPNGAEHWEWERNVGVACALIKGYYARHYELTQRRNFDMSLDTQNNSRDYLYGRLLAIAENIESYALYLAGEKRATNAERYMQRFAENPYTTWRNLELALDPYKNRLRNNRYGFLKKRNDEMDAVINQFIPETFTDNSKLSGEFLLGYHCQKMHYRLAQEEPAETEDTQN